MERGLPGGAVAIGGPGWAENSPFGKFTSHRKDLSFTALILLKGLKKRNAVIASRCPRVWRAPGGRQRERAGSWVSWHPTPEGSNASVLTNVSMVMAHQGQ